MYKEHIPISRWKVLLLTLGSLAFVLAGYYFVRNGHWFQILIGIIGIIFFGFTFFFGITKLVSRRAGLILTEEGFNDNSSMTGGGFITWDSVRGFRYTKIERTRMIYVFVKDPESVIAEKTGVTRFLMRMNYKLVGTPVTISTVLLACSFDELVEKMEEGRELATIRKNAKIPS